MESHVAQPNLIAPVARYRWPRLILPTPSYINTGTEGGGSGWGQLGTATLAADTTNYEAWDVPVATARRQGTKITPTGAGATNDGAWMNVLPADVGQDWRYKDAFVRLYLHPGTPGEADSFDNITYIKGAVYTAADAGGTSKYVYFARPAYSNTLGWSGWHTFYWPRPQGYANAIKSFSIYRTGPIAAGPVWTFDNLVVYPAAGTYGYVSFMFDKGYKDQFWAGRLLHQNGISGQFNVSPAFVGQTGYMTLDQIRLLRGMGHRICCYPSGMNAGEWTAWYLQTLARKKRNLLGCQQWLRDHSLADGTSEYVMSTPGSGFNLDDVSLFQDRYFLAITGTSWLTQLWSPYAVDLCNGFVPYLNAVGASASDALASANISREWINVMGHIASTDPGSAEGFLILLTQALGYIAAGTMRSTTISDILEGKV